MTTKKKSRGLGRPFKKNSPDGEKDPRINRTGRPKSYKEFTEGVRIELEPLALQKLRQQLNHKNPIVVQGAIKEVLNRSRGRAPQPLTGEGGEGPVNFEAAEAELLRALLSTESKLKGAPAAEPAAPAAPATDAPPPEPTGER